MQFTRDSGNSPETLFSVWPSGLRTPGTGLPTPSQSSVHCRTFWHALFWEQWGAKGKKLASTGIPEVSSTVTSWLRSRVRFLAGAGASRRGRTPFFVAEDFLPAPQCSVQRSLLGGTLPTSGKPAA